MTFILRCLCIILTLNICQVFCIKPIAYNLIYHVDPGEDIEIELAGHNHDGNKLGFTVISLPQNGELYQLSKIYSKHGYDPKRATSPIREVPTVVTGSRNRLIFRRFDYGGPPRDSKYAEFSYTVKSGKEISKEAIVVLSTNSALVSSIFFQDTEGWRIISNGDTGAAAQPKHQAITRGSLLSYYIYGLDAVIHSNSVGDDATRWYFSAPSKFLGNHWAAYGGKLDFVLSSAEGSFDETNLNLRGRDNFVILECTKCDRNRGITLVMPLNQQFRYDGSTTQFSLPLTEEDGWKKDPKNTILPWQIPTKCEFVQVLSGLSSLRILGDFTRGYESVALDSVYLRHGSKYPMECY